MKITKLLFTLSFMLLVACGGKGGGDSAKSPPPASTNTSTNTNTDTQYCVDINATNKNLALPCVCAIGYTVDSTGKNCTANSQTGSAPIQLAYSPNPKVITLGTNLPQGSFFPSVSNCTVDGGGKCSFSVVGNAPLPSGLSINSQTGAISGLASGITSSQPVGTRTVTVRASNAYGSIDTDVQIRIAYPSPTGLSYNASSLPATGAYKVGQSISPLIFTHTSSYKESVTSMTITPALPAGLSFNLYNGDFNYYAITGTPSASSPATTYTVSACGPTAPCQTLNLTFSTQIAPSAFSYNISGINGCVIEAGLPKCTFNQGQTFNDILPVVSGDNLTFSIVSGGEGAISATTLPSGISLSSTGKIYTTSFGAFESTSCSAGGNGYCLYTIKAANSVGSVLTSFKLKINGPAAPTGLMYTGSPYLFRALTAIDKLSPVFNNNQNPDCYASSGCFTVSPSLPSGLSLSSISGQIVGTPDKNAIQPSTTYVISVNDSRGVLTTSISIEVKERLPVFRYTSNGIFVLQKGINVSANSSTPAVINEAPLCTGSNNNIPVTSFSVSPALPAGLSLNPNAYGCGNPADQGGAISGIPSALSESKNYTIKACNSGGCSEVVINLEVAGNIEKVVSGLHHACALVKEEASSTGKVMCWGANDKNQLGFASSESCLVDGTSVNCSKKGKFVKLNGVDLDNVIEISVGKNHSCAIRDANLDDNQQGSNSSTALVGGALYCWGDNSSGQLGVGSNLPQSGLVKMTANSGTEFSQVTHLSAGGDNTCLAGEATSASLNYRGQVYCAGQDYGNRAVKIIDSSQANGVFSVRSLKVGEHHACAIARELDQNNDLIDGKLAVKCWGDNSLSQLGSQQPSSFLAATSVNTSAGNLIGGISLTSGKNHSCAVVTGNSLFCWGDNTYGQLGRNTVGGQSALASSVLNTNGSALTSISSVGSSANATYAIVSNNTTLTYQLNVIGKYALAAAPYVGENTGGRLVSIKKNYGGGAVDFNATALASSSSANEDFACAVDQLQSSVSCWGMGEGGQLGNNSEDSSVLANKVILSY